ncbi:MAG: energy-coupling factor ABC transporter ATP-binding protein [Rhodospirillales bacterium]
MTPLALHAVTYAAGGVTLLDDVTLALAPGRRTVLVGPNGAGKSLLLRLLHGLIRPTGGRVEGAGAGQAMVFQRPVLLRRTALANVGYALAVRGVGRAEREILARAALDRFGLGALAARPARVLSGGEQQRLAIARAWATRPSVLLLDEPTSALDPAATRAVEAAVREIHGDGVTVVMSTQDLGQARRLAEELVVLHRGRVADSGPAARVFAEPADATVAAFLAGDLVD